MGAKLTAILCACLLLCGCTPKQEYMPYTQQEDGTSRYPLSDYTSHQVLEWCEGTFDTLTKGELSTYHGSLYAISNYRAYLLSKGFQEVASENSASVLDSMLDNGDERVRLIYQSSGTIRIIMENPDGLAHILLEGI